tara:strand:+ start:464 stop:970 length:507 start_codon:yes stop_codon:yes gene_type:complete
VILKILNSFLIILLLQSCSGGTIGNFLELSFRNIEEEESKSNENNPLSEKFKTNKKKFKDSNKRVMIETPKDFTNSTKKINLQKKQNLKSDKIYENQKIVTKKNIVQDEDKKIESNYDPQSYRVIIIFKAVDPTAPSQKFSKVLKNANILFEIERIERFQESDFKKLK